MECYILRRRKAITEMRSIACLFSLLLTPSMGCSNNGKNAVNVKGDGAQPNVSLVLAASGFEKPVHITHAGDGSGRLFLVEQKGRIILIKTGGKQATPFLDISARVSCCGERGLLSVAFPSAYASKKYFYVNYTDRSGDTVVARYHVTDSSPDIADPNSEEVILRVDQPYANHNGGRIAFGPDGYLYIGMGDGGYAGDPHNHARNPRSLLGKMLRVDVESGTKPYTVPQSNPFVQDNTYRPEIWALGLRNTWRFSFDRLTETFLSRMSGKMISKRLTSNPCQVKAGKTTDGTLWRAPIVTGTPAVIRQAGGTVYRGDAYPGLKGIYFYGDYCSGRIRGGKYDGTIWRNILLLDTSLSITSFGEDEAGNIYVTDYSGGDVYRIIAPK